MALNKQTVSLPLALGQDTKNNPVLVDQAKFVLLQNATFSKGSSGQVHTRNGYVTLPQVDTSANPITAGTAMATVNGEMDLLADGEFYAFSESQQAFIPRGTLTPVVPTFTQIVDNAYIQSGQDSDTLNGVTVYTWSDTRGGVWCKVVDENTGAILKADSQLDALGTKARVFINGTKLVTMWSTSGGNIYYTIIDPANPTANLTFTLLISSIADNATFDVVTVPGGFVIAYDNSSPYLTLANMDTGYNLTNTTVYGVAGPTAALSLAYNSAYSTPYVQASWINSTNLYCALVDPANVSTSYAGLPTTDLTLYLTGEVYALASYANGNYIQLFLGDTEVDGASYTWTTLTSAGIPGTFTAIADGLALASQPLLIGSTWYLLGVFPGELQQTYFLYNAATGQIVGRFLSANAGPPTFLGRLPHWMALPSGQSGLAITQANVIIASSGGVTTDLYGISEMALNFEPGKTVSTQLGPDLTIATGLPQIYDGTTVVEDGFNVFPLMGATRLNSNISMVLINAGADFTITFPTNPDGSGNDGEMLLGQEYIYLKSPTAGTRVFWLNLNNAYSAPTGPGTGPTYTAIVIYSYWTATEIAAAASAVIGTAVNTDYVITQTGGKLAFAGTGDPPSLISQMSSWVLSQVASSSVAKYRGAMLPGYMYQPGQWFGFQSIDGSGDAVNCYVWFNVNGVGTDPAPFGASGRGAEAVISSTSSETAVAITVAAAISANHTAMFVNTITAPTDFIVPITTSNTGTLTLLATSGTVATGQAGSQSITGTSTYQFCACYEWVDNQGLLHRSAPSVPVSVSMTNTGIQNGTFKLTVATLQLSARTNVYISIYRTALNGTLFQRVTSGTSLLYNTTAFDSITYYDATSDFALASSEVLYTTGGIAPNNPPPACTQVMSNLDRLWLVDAENNQTIWWSKFFQSGIAVEWSALQTTKIDASGGQVVAIAAMDSNTIVFAQRAIWIISGSGPDAAGGGTAFNGPNIVSSAVGCRDPGSVVLVPAGLIFKSSKGFCLLDRGLQVHTDFGFDVAAYNADVVTAATVIPNTTEVRFLSATGTTLLYDYQYGQWSPFTNHQGVDALVYNGNYYYLRSSGAVYEESPGYYFDNLTGFSLLATTSWLKVSGVQGFQRVWKSFLQGLFPGVYPVTVGIAYDYNPSVGETHQLNPTAGSSALAKQALGPFVVSPYLIANDANTVGHWNAEDLKNGTANIGPAWTMVGSVPYNVSDTPKPSVGPFSSSNYFTLPANSVMNQPGSFTVIVLFNTQSLIGADSTSQLLVTNGDPWASNGFALAMCYQSAGYYIGPTASVAAFTGSAFHQVAGGYDAGAGNAYFGSDNAANTSFGTEGQPKSTIGSTMGGVVDSPAYQVALLNGKIIEVWISTDVPSQTLFGNVWANLGNASSYAFDLNTYITPSTLTLYAVHSGTKTAFATDNGSGVLSGTSTPTGACTGTVDYTTGEIAFQTLKTPTTYTIEADYTYMLSVPSSTQFRIFNKKQTCEAIQLTVSTSGPFNNAQSVAIGLNALDLEVGVRKGGYKNLGPGQSI